MPFSGPGDPNLPANVKKLPETRRSQWVSVWNSAFAKCQREGGGDCEGKAFRQANGVALASDSLITRTIRGVEILREGIFHGNQEIVVTTDRMDEMVEAFEATKGVLDPPLKLGHDEDQRLLQEDGFPAAGWVESLRRVGSRLLADFVRIPAKVADLLEVGAFRKRSSEVMFDMEIGDRTWPTVLVGVALLGEDLPAVSGLDDITALYGDLKMTLAEGASPIPIGFDEENLDELPDLAFAGVASGGKLRRKKTTPRNLRLLPHHGTDGITSAELVTACLSQLPQIHASVALKHRMIRHLSRHVRKEKLGKVGVLSSAKEALHVEDEIRDLLDLDDDTNVYEVVKGLLALSTELKKVLEIKEGENILDKVTALTKVEPKPEPKGDDKPADDKPDAEIKKELAATQARVVALEQAAATAGAEAQVDEAIKAGKILPAVRESAIKLAQMGGDAFKEYLEASPKGSVPTGESGSEGEDGTVGDLSQFEPTAAEKKLAEDMGVWSDKHRIDMIRTKAENAGISLPADFGKPKKEDDK